MKISKEALEKRRVYGRNYYYENKKKMSERQKERNKINKERNRIYAAEWREKNPEYASNWRKRNPEKIKGYNLKLREKMRGDTLNPLKGMSFQIMKNTDLPLTRRSKSWLRIQQSSRQHELALKACAQATTTSCLATLSRYVCLSPSDFYAGRFFPTTAIALYVYIPRSRPDFRHLRAQGILTRKRIQGTILKKQEAFFHPDSPKGMGIPARHLNSKEIAKHFFKRIMDPNRQPRGKHVWTQN